MPQRSAVLDTIAFDRVDDVVILCGGDRDPSDADNEVWIERLGMHDFKGIVISVRGGGRISAKQRARVGEFWKQSGRTVPRVVLLTDSRAARMILTALGWLTGGESKGFGLDDYDDAIAFLQVTASPVAVKEAVDRMQAALGPRAPSRAG